MERIQSAIKKAREARQQPSASVDGKAASAPAMTLKADQAAQDVTYLDEDQLWSSLTQIKLDSKQLYNARIVGDKAGDTSAPFDALRTRMLHQMRTNNWRRIAITSPGPACGKTTLCLNLAFSFARQRDFKTMVIDLDMRRPSIDKILKQEGQRCFANALERHSVPEDHMFCYKQKLAFATNSKSVQNPAELLQDTGAANVIDRLEEQYKPDIILFDTPPMLACDDTYAFLDQIDCVLMVAAAGSSTSDEIEKCEREIVTRCNYLGVVLNKCRYLDNADSYGY